MTLSIGTPQENTFWQRLTTAVRSARSSWNKSSFNEYDNLLWGDYAQRLQRYGHFWYMYKNRQYDDLTGYATMFKTDEGLYTHISSLYNPVNRLVETYVNNIFAGAINFDDPTQGAIPLVADDNIILGISQLWKTSNIQKLKSRLVRRGAMQGDVGIKIVENKELGIIKLEVIPASQIAYAKFNDNGDIVHVVLAIRRQDTSNSLPYVYAEEITPDVVRTYKDGSLFAYNEDGLKEWENPYGIVPVVTAQHIDIGKAWGENSFDGIMHKVDRANDAASIALDNIRRMNKSPWLLPNASSGLGLEVSNVRDDLNFISAPDVTTAIPLVQQVNLAGTLEHIQEILKEIEKDLPVLDLAKIRDFGTPPSGHALSMMFKDATQVLQESEQNYGASLVKAQEIALYIGAQNRYEGYRQLASASQEDLHHSLKETALFDEQLSKRELIDLFKELGVPAEYILKEAKEWDEATLAQVVSAIQTRERLSLAAFGAGLDKQVEEALVTK